ncbi:MAG: hypothetical protein JNM44_02850 [Chitinophagaceae bacterium]|nr:hypothetical protein [Chitinophagaceae bacterium]
MATISQFLDRLQLGLQLVDAHEVEAVRSFWKQTARRIQKANASLWRYHDLMLFVLAHPLNAEFERFAKSELKRLQGILKADPGSEALDKSGLYRTTLSLRFSWEMTRKLLEDKHCRICWHSVDEQAQDPGLLLKAFMPTAWKELCSSGLNLEDLLLALGVAPQNRLNFLVGLLDIPQIDIAVRDAIWAGLGVYTTLEFTKVQFSRSYNQIPVKTMYSVNPLLKKFDHQQLLNTPLPAPDKLSSPQQSVYQQVIQRALVLMARETDPSTFMDLTTLRVYSLERGIQIALFGMPPERQLPYVSYVGYMLFRNGYPLAYGGSWIWGGYAKFGLNIFEPYRGGESGYILCQLLRVYKQAFTLNAIEIDAYQFGLDNPDGIRSGAYWFYYRYGFRSRLATLQRLADREKKRMQENPSYRSKESTLLQFTQSNMIWREGKLTIPEDCATLVQRYVARRYQGDVVNAGKEALNWAEEALGFPKLTPKERGVLQEFALWLQASGQQQKLKHPAFSLLLRAKTKDPYQYNVLLSSWLYPSNDK